MKDKKKDKEKRICVDGKGVCLHRPVDLCIRDQNGQGCSYYKSK